MSRYRVEHVTEYRYESPVTSSYGQVCLLPRDLDGQRCVEASLTVEPGPSDVGERVDYFGNRRGYFHVDRPHTLLSIAARSEVEIDRSDQDLDRAAGLTLKMAAEQVTSFEGQERVQAACYLLGSARTTSADQEVTQRVRDYASASLVPDRPVIEGIEDLLRRINRDFTFAPDATQVTSTVADLFETGAGVCQDFAHLAVSCLRACGLPGRYVSGYLETDPPPGRAKLQGSDVSHAWPAAMIPGLGWIDFDPTNNQFVNDRYVTTAWGRDYGDVSPVSGVIYSDGGMTVLRVAVDVTRLDQPS